MGRNEKLIRFFLLSLLSCLLPPGLCFAQKLTVLYTGQTHAALYHCDCPKEPDGGLSRRMSMVKELRSQNPNTLLVDAGGFFAGGVSDEHSQGAELDEARNGVNLAAMGLMGYDAACIGDDEFNFGRDYLIRQIKGSGIHFLSANLKIDQARPYLIKDVSGARIALIGLTNEEARAKSGGLEMEGAKQALVRTIQELRQNKVDLTLVLSYLGEEEDMALLKEVEGIDILISGRPQDRPEAYSRAGQGILLRSSWQGRRLGKLELELAQGKIKDFKVEQLRLSDKIADAPQISKILPECFSDSDCRAQALSGQCNSPGEPDAACKYEEPRKIPLLIIQPKDSRTINQEQFLSYLRRLFPGISAQFINYDAMTAREWLKKVNPKLFPVYLLAKEADEENKFRKIKEFARLIDGYYYIEPRFSGSSIFAGRPKIPRRLDVFMGTKGKNIKGILALLREFKAAHNELEIQVHYLALEGKNGFAAPGGISELEEELRQVCIRKHYPQMFWDYASCRADFQESTWWDVCAQQFGIDRQAVKDCGLSQEGISLLRENVELNRELEISSGTVFLVNNYEVFAINGVPAKEEMGRILGFEGAKK